MMMNKTALATAIFALYQLPAALVPVAAEEASTERHKVSINTLASGLSHPWGMTFLPSGNLLITEQIRHLSDLLLRRVRIGLLMPEGGKAHLDRIQKLCAPELPWDDKRWQEERKAYLDHWHHAHSVPL